MLIDRFGRIANDLRISVTDRCNYRCTYCMPADVQWMPKPQILTFEEIEFLTRIFAEEGVREIRLTGGEPLVRKNLPDLITRLRQINPIQEISLTTNGYYLQKYAKDLRSSGVDRINISCDSLKPHRFEQITGSNSFDRVMAGIEEAQQAGFFPIKINCVVIRGFNDDEILDFLMWGEQRKLQIRFIEFMPLDGDHKWKRQNVVSQKEIVEIARRQYEVTKAGQSEPSPATKFSYNEGKGDFGVIPSVSEPFCGSCNRVRITADGKFRTCLFAIDEIDLRSPLRSGASGAEISEMIRAAVREKWAGHHINDHDFQQPARAMYAIGG